MKCWNQNTIGVHVIQAQWFLLLCVCNQKSSDLVVRPFQVSSSMQQLEYARLLTTADVGAMTTGLHRNVPAD